MAAVTVTATVRRTVKPRAYSAINILPSFTFLAVLDIVSLCVSRHNGNGAIGALKSCPQLATGAPLNSTAFATLTKKKKCTKASRARGLSVSAARLAGAWRA